MPHSERTFKPKIRSPGAVFEIWLMSTDFKEFWMEKRLSNIFKTTNITKLIKAILKSSDGKPYNNLSIF